jgi:hypothetical protein
MEIMTPNILLTLMLTSYAVPIVFVYFKYAPPTNVHDILRIMLYAQILFMLVTVIGVLQDAANFAIFYLYLHYHTFCSSPSPSPSPSLSPELPSDASNIL